MSYPSRYRPKQPRQAMRTRIIVFALVAVAVSGGVAAVYGLQRPVPAERTNPLASSAGRNDARKQALKNVSEALRSYAAAHPSLPIKLSARPLEICAGASPDCRVSGLADLGFLLGSTSLSSIPTDPLGGPGRYGSGFTLARDAAGRMVLTAPRAEDGATITVTQ